MLIGNLEDVVLLDGGVIRHQWIVRVLGDVFEAFNRLFYLFLLVSAIDQFESYFFLVVLGIFDAFCQSVDLIYIKIVWGHQSLLMLLLQRLRVFFVDTVVDENMVGILVLRSLKIRDWDLGFWR